MGWMLLLALLGTLEPAEAQIERVAIRTTGISCGVCAVVSEINFRRMPGVDEVKISLSKETVVLTYKPGVVFDAVQIRRILQPLKVGIVRLDVSAQGRVQERDGKRYFIAGKNQFVVVEGANAIAVETPMLVEGVVDDPIERMELRIRSFKLLKGEGTARLPSAR